MTPIVMLAASLILLILLLLILILFFFFCKPWRRIFHPNPSSPTHDDNNNRHTRRGGGRRRPVPPALSAADEAADLEKPLVLDNYDTNLNEIENFIGVHGQVGPSHYVEGNNLSPRRYGTNGKHPVSSLDLAHGIPPITQIVKHANWESEKTLSISKAGPILNSVATWDDNVHRAQLPLSIKSQRSSITLEVLSGPATGLLCSLASVDPSKKSLTIGRVAPNDLVLKDVEVSGKHAIINWNSDKSRWELVDMGSLNGTTLNSKALRPPDSDRGHWSEPGELASGDVIALGSSKLLVNIVEHQFQQIPLGVGMASDPMAFRKGGKKLPMEDVCSCQWPLPGTDQFGLFAIFDGHGGSEASKAASRILPKMVSELLASPEKRERILSRHDASDVLTDAFRLTEDAMDYEYEGCCATALLVWFSVQNVFFAQCANVGDSACVFSIDGKQIIMTEDHRVTSHSERIRMMEIGEPLGEGETRIHGINIARMLGDKFLKEHDSRFTSAPYISQVLQIPSSSRAFALLASDGLWDVLSPRKAAQHILQHKEDAVRDQSYTPQKIADLMLNDARNLRTKDNTSVIFLDFDNGFDISKQPN